MFVAPLEKFKQGLISEGSGIGWVGGHWRPDQCLSFVSESDDEGWTLCYETFLPFKFAKVGPSNLGQKLGTTNDFPSVAQTKVNSHWQLFGWQGAKDSFRKFWGTSKFSGGSSDMT